MSALASPALRRSFHVMAKPMGARCNLACKYCYYLEKERAFYPGAGVPRMSDATLERFIRDYIAAQPPAGEIHFAWQGGEPTLLGLDTFRRIVAWQRAYAPGRVVQNALQTNGTLLDEAWGGFLHAENFLVGISIDGPRHLHDPYRIDAGGRPTWEKVMRGLRVLRRHKVEFNTLTVVHRRNCRHASAIYDFLLEQGSRHLQFIPLVELRPTAADSACGLHHAAPDETRLVAPEDAAEAVSGETVPPGRFGAFLNEIFDRWVRRDVGRVFVQQFESALSARVGAGPTMCVFQERCGRSLALEHDGTVYSCDHYVYPGHALGSIASASPRSLAALANSPAAARLGDLKAALSARCRACPVLASCHGDCPKHRFVRAPGDGRALSLETAVGRRSIAQNVEPNGARGIPTCTQRVHGAGDAGGRRPTPTHRGARRPDPTAVTRLSYLCDDYLALFSHVAPAMQRMAALLCAGRSPAEVMRGG